MDSDLSPRSCMNAIIGLLLLLLFCFIIGIALQIAWQLLTGVVTRDTTRGTPLVLPTVIASELTMPLESGTQTPSITASKTEEAEKSPQAKAKASRTPTITLSPTLTEYIVRAGDTFGAIAVEYHISIEAILAINPDINPNRLRIGEVLIIPPPSTTTPSVRSSNSPFISPTKTPRQSRVATATTKKATTPPTKHTIQAGDTLLDIAFEYDISLEALLKANPSLNPGALRIGEVIVIPTE